MIPKNMEKSDVLRRIVSVILILTLITGFFVNLPLSASAEDTEMAGGKSNIVNGSFEYPALRANDIKDGAVGDGWDNVVYDDKAYDPNLFGWKTTAYDKRIEFAWLKNTNVADNMSPHMKPTIVQTGTGVATSDGYQFAEVVATRISSLFQVLPVKAGEDYSWTVHHRGRSGTDTLAFIIADKSVAYQVPTSGASDCFQQILKWLKDKGVTAPAAGKRAEYTVYTTKLTATLYSFEAASSGSCFSDSPDAEHTEKFSVYLMSTAKNDWGEYTGTYSSDADKDIFFVLSPFSTTFSSASGGNLIDNLSFTDKTGKNLLKNAGFDDVTINSTYLNLSAANAASPTAGVGWSTTATDFVVEVGNIQKGDAYGLGVTTETIKPSIRDGEQFAELNADEESSLYQIVNTDPGKMYKWSLSHRGRDAIDTMALIIGPAQFNKTGGSIPPKKTSKDARDQLMQISDWLYSQTDMPLDLPINGGCSDKIKVYTPKFNADGGWSDNSGQTVSENIFSFYKDEIHTEEWSVWVIASKNDKWYDYGELDSTATYSYECVIPEKQENTIFGFVSHLSLKADGTKNSLSYGNLLDYIAFKEYYYAKVEVAMNNSHGWATVIADNQEDFLADSKSNQSGWALMGGTVTINVKEREEGDPNRRDFVGAYVNGVFIPITNDENCPWKYDAESGTYNLTIENVNSAIKAYVIFVAQQIYYDTRSPNVYRYDLDKIDSGPEVPMSSGEGKITKYTSHEPDLTNLDGWKFMGWKYINPADNSVTIFKAVHTVTLVGEPGSQTFKVTDGTNTVENIPYDEGITFLAEWKYRQRAIAQTYKEEQSAYVESTEGGTVNIAISHGRKGEEDETAAVYTNESGALVGSELYAYADDTYVTVTATHIAGYTFNGWYDKSGNLVNKNASYVYKVNSGMTETLYAHFDPAGCDLKLDCSTYSNDSGDTDKYFKIYCFLSGLRAEKLYTLSYVSGGVVSNESFEADADGEALVTLNMKHGDSAEFIYLPERCQYTIKADSETSDGFGIKGEVTNKVLTRPTGVQEARPKITEHIIFFKVSQFAFLDVGKHYAGIAAGKDEITITKKSSYTFTVETMYTPSMYSGLDTSLCFYDSAGTANDFFTGTRILMIDLTNQNEPKYYSYTVNDSVSAIDLTQFTELGSADAHFAPKTGEMLTEKLVFIVDYVGTNDASSGKISLVYSDDGGELANILTPPQKAVNIGEDTTELTAVGSGNTSSDGPFAISVTVSESSPAVNTTYEGGESGKYAVKLSLDSGTLPNGSYAVVDGKTYYSNNGYIKISPIKPGKFTANVYSPVPLELVDNKVTFKVSLLSAVSTSASVPGEITKTPIEFNCVDVAIDAEVSNKVLSPGNVRSANITLKRKNLDEVKLTVSQKNSDGTYTEILTDVNVNLPADDAEFTVNLSNSFNAESGKTYIFSFVGYVGGLPVCKDECCVVCGYVLKNN